MNNPINLFIVLALVVICLLGGAAWWSLDALQWLLIRLCARRLALIAYRAEWKRAIAEFEDNPERLAL